MPPYNRWPCCKTCRDCSCRPSSSGSSWSPTTCWPASLRLYSEADIHRVRIIRFLTRRQGVNLAGVKVILQLEALGKIRVYDLFDADDVERFVEEGEPEPEAAAAGNLDRRDT